MPSSNCPRDEDLNPYRPPVDVQAPCERFDWSCLWVCLALAFTGSVMVFACGAAFGCYLPYHPGLPGGRCSLSFDAFVGGIGVLISVAACLLPLLRRGTRFLTIIMVVLLLPAGCRFLNDYTECGVGSGGASDCEQWNGPRQFSVQVGKGPEPGKPNHSQLSKDHDDHPLHVIAAECAAEASRTVGKAMAKAWAGEKTLAEVQHTALGYFFHPQRMRVFTVGDTVPDAEVFFATNSFVLDAKDKQVLRQVKDILDSDSALVVDIWAYANDGGSLAADRKLSNRRGDAVRDYLVNDLKVPRSQIGAVVPGSTGPSVLDSYQTAEAQAARGRRVEFRVVKAGGGTEPQRSIMRKIEEWSKQPANQKAIKQTGSEEWAWGQVKKVEEALKKLNKVQKDPWGAAVEFYQQLEKLRGETDAKKLKEGAKKAGEGAKDLAQGAKKKYDTAKEDAKAIKDKELPSAKKKAEEVGGEALDAQEPVPGAKQTEKALKGAKSVLGEKK